MVGRSFVLDDLDLSSAELNFMGAKIQKSDFARTRVAQNHFASTWHTDSCVNHA